MLDAARTSLVQQSNATFSKHEPCRTGETKAEAEGEGKGVGKGRGEGKGKEEGNMGEE